MHILLITSNAIIFIPLDVFELHVKSDKMMQDLLETNPNALNSKGVKFINFYTNEVIPVTMEMMQNVVGFVKYNTLPRQ